MSKLVKYILLLIGFINAIYSQSMYYTKYLETSIEYEVNGQTVLAPITDWSNSSIYEYNFVSRETKKILSLDMQYDWYFSTDDNTRFFVQSLVTDTLYVFENENFGSKTPVFPIASVRRIMKVFDLPKQGKICFILGSSDMPTLKKDKSLLVLDRNDYTILDTIKNIDFDNEYYPNQNQDIAYKFLGDFDGFYFSSISFNNFAVMDSCKKYKEITNLSKWHLMDVKNGYFLIMYETNNIRNYIAYNPSFNSSSVSIECNFLGEKYLSSLADKMILGNNSGDYYIFCCESGEFLKRIKIEDDSKLYFFNNYPDSLFILSNFDTDDILGEVQKPDINSSICVNISDFQSTDSLLSMLSEDIDNFLAEGSITDQSVAEELRVKIEQKDMDGILNIIEEQKESGINEEAYYSLKMNESIISERLADEQLNDGLPIKFIDSQGGLIPDGSLKYYISGWQEVENDSSGVFYIDSDKEMIKLRMNYGSANFDTTVINDTTKTIFIQTNQVIVKLQDSENNLIDEGIVKYYASGWREIGTTVAGKVEKELLPNSYKIRVTYNGRNYDLQQDISQNPLVEVQVEE